MTDLKSGEIVSKGRDFSGCESFNEMGRELIVDSDAGFTVREGQVFECETVKGDKNLIVAMRLIGEWLYYTQGDKCKKVLVADFHRAVLNGDIEPKKPTEIDAGRMSMAMIGFDAIANRRTGEETIMHYEGVAEERFLRGEG